MDLYTTNPWAEFVACVLVLVFLAAFIRALMTWGDK